MINPDYKAALQPVFQAFDALAIPYQIGGSVASSAYGMARATLDVDVVADLHLPQVAEFVKRLQNDYYLEEQSLRDAIRTQACFNVIHQATMLKIDVFVLKRRTYDQEAFSRRRSDTLGDAPDALPCYLASPEDVIINKLEWYRLGNRISERQWNDLVGVIRVQGATLDMVYVSRWAAELGLSDLLAQARKEALNYP